jgi:N-acetylmuramoyl-L-alanine amidase
MSLEALCLAVAIFFESKGEPIKGQYAVAEVVLNRRDHPKQYRDTVCGVVSEKGQFQWYKNQNHTKIPYLVRNKPELYTKHWETAKKVANDSLKNKTNHTKGALFFNTLNKGVRYKTKVQSVKIGNHVFY